MFWREAVCHLFVIAVGRRLAAHVCYFLPFGSSGGSRSGSHPPPVTSFTSAGTPDRSVHGAGVGHTKTNPWQLIIAQRGAVVGFRWQRKRDIQHRSAELYSLNYGIRGSLVNTVCGLGWWGRTLVWFRVAEFGGRVDIFPCQTFCPKRFSECDSLLCLQ